MYALSRDRPLADKRMRWSRTKMALPSWMFAIFLFRAGNFARGMPGRHANLAVALMFPIVGSSLTPL